MNSFQIASSLKKSAERSGKRTHLFSKFCKAHPASGFSMLLRPSNLFAALTLMQLLVWIMVDADVLFIAGLASKYISFIAFTRYGILVLLFFTVLRFAEGRDVLRFCEQEPRSFGSLFAWAGVLSILYFIGIGGLILNFAGNAHAFINSIATNFTFSTQNLGDTDSGFLSNLSPLIASIYTYLLTSGELPRERRRSVITLLVLIVLCALFEGLVYSRRLQFFMCLFAIILTVLVVRHIKINPVVFLAGVFLVFAMVVAFELSRWGMQNAARNAIPIVSLKNISMTIQYMLASYFYSDLNNAFVMLGNAPDYSLVYGAAPQMSSFVWSLFGLNPSSFNFLNDYTSSYGTVNVLGIWWESAGWLSMAYISVVGVVAGSLWRGVVKRGSFNVYSVVMFVLVVLGIINGTRINYFLTTKFLVPLLGFLIMYIFTKSKRM